jgi:hypothetical protein
LTKYGLGYISASFFHKLIWSPCSNPYIGPIFMYFDLRLPSTFFWRTVAGERSWSRRWSWRWWRCPGGWSGGESRPKDSSGRRQWILIFSGINGVIHFQR